MTVIHGRHTKITIDAVDLSTYTKTTSFEDSVSMHDTTTYGPTRERKSYEAGLGDGKITIAGQHNNAAGGPRATLKPLMAAKEAVAFVFQPEGTGTGKQQSLVDVFVMSYNESDAVDDIIQWTAELQMTGDLDEDNQT
jgi:hypothetical protein